MRAGIRETPDFAFLAALWSRFERELSPGDLELGKVLQPSYVLGERLVATQSAGPVTVPVLADGVWRPSTAVFATRSDELAALMAKDGLWRWDAEAADMFPHLMRSIGIFDVDRAARFTRVTRDTYADVSLEAHVQRAVLAFAADVRAVQAALWAAVRPRVAELVRGRVQVVDPLRLHVSVSHPNIGQRDYEFSASAY